MTAKKIFFEGQRVEGDYGKDGKYRGEVIRVYKKSIIVQWDNSDDQTRFDESQYKYLNPINQ